MKIGLVIYGSLRTVSGGNLYDRKLVDYLHSQGDEVRILSIPPASYASHLLAGLGFRLPSDLEIIVEDELVHPSVLFANKRRVSIPILSLVHNLHSSERRAAWLNLLFQIIEKWHLASVDGYIFNSAATAASVTSLIGNSKAHVLAPPGGDRLGGLNWESVRRRAAMSGPLRLLFLANVTPLKGLYVVLEALKELPAGICTLDVVGSLTVDVAYANRMQQQAAALPMPITFHGILDGEPLVALLRRSDVSVLPSYYEGFGIAYLEGMAFGLPAIGTTAGAIPQMIRDDANGYMIAPGDSRALSVILTRLSSDRELLARLSLGALTYFASCPTWDQSAEMIRAFLLRLLDHPRSQARQSR